MSTLATTIGRGTTGSRPAASEAGRLYYDTTAQVWYRDNGSSWDSQTPSALTDPTSARGEMIRRGAASLEAVQAKTLGKALIGDGTDIVSAYPPGFQIDYVEFTASVNVTGTSSGTAQTIVTGNATTFDGTAVWVDFFAETVDTPAGNNNLTFELWLDGAQLLTFGQLLGPDGVNTLRWPVKLERKLTPSAGSHTLLVKAYVSSGTGVVRAGAGTGGAGAPGFLRVKKA